jgi:hypothetical protein
MTSICYLRSQGSTARRRNWALHFGHRAEARIFTLPQGQNIIQLSRSQTQQKAAPIL